jgi:hypothetical protein
MKKIVTALLLLHMVLTGHSQVLISIIFGDKLNSDKLEFGLMVSPTLCNITHDSAQYRFGLGLALYFNWKLSDRFYFHPEAIPKSAMGARGIKPYPTGDSSLDKLFAGGEVIRKINTISLPFLVRYRITGLWFAETGPQIDWMLKTKDEFTHTVNGNDLTYTKKISSEITNFDVGWAVGLVYKFSQQVSMSMGIRYFYGFTDIVKTSPGNQHNSTWLLNLYIPIGANKAAAKRRQVTAAR